MNENIRHYVVLKTTPSLWKDYRSGEVTKVQNYISRNLVAFDVPAPFSVVALPSNRGEHPSAEGPGFAPKDPPRELVAGLMFETPKAAKRFQDTVRNQTGEIFVGSGADLPFSGSDHWCPREASDPIFGDRAAAERLLRVPYVRDTKNLRGRNVNVVIVDQGLDKQALGTNYGGGWPVHSTLPGSAKSPPGSNRRPHGMMIAHNVLAVAPEATLFDLPMVPPRIIEVEQFFLHTADAAFRSMLDSIAQFRAGNQWPGPWVLVNAWAIFDRTHEYPAGSYTNDPNHPFNQMISEAVDTGIDIVFCAGNCGQFCPDMRCGAFDQGPGSSIFGANCHPKVLSVGAVRTDTLWLGYSSQGPGQVGFGARGHDKPDLCAPSQFHETDDAYTTNGGTSAACALSGGVIAALRSNPTWNSTAVPPERLKKVLNETARKTNGPNWNNRLGNGILNAEAAFRKLP